ncbi:Uncharacterised protein [Mycobacteroides abscessus subsp. abscessus]|nr:Uncharacterised protein [Mycobacteroides abscessus subsp. abscessus]
MVIVEPSPKPESAPGLTWSPSAGVYPCERSTESTDIAMVETFMV